jgi:hypothetical protein
MGKNCFLEFLNPDTPRMLEKLAEAIQWDAAAKRLKAADDGIGHTKTLLRLFTIELCFGFSDQQMQSAAKDSLSVRAFLKDAVISEKTLLAMTAFRLALRESRSGQLVMNEISDVIKTLNTKARGISLDFTVIPPGAALSKTTRMWHLLPEIELLRQKRIPHLAILACLNEHAFDMSIGVYHDTLCRVRRQAKCRAPQKMEGDSQNAAKADSGADGLQKTAPLFYNPETPKW